MSEDKVIIERKEEALFLRINNPQALNCLDLDILEHIHLKMQSLSDSYSAGNISELPQAVVISGEGDKAFVAGADIKLMQEANLKKLESFIRLGQSTMLSLSVCQLLLLPQLMVMLLVED